MLKQPLHNEEFEAQPNGVSGDGIVSGINPFPGLRPFSFDESYLYFGREGHVNEILLKISQNRFVTVMGYSGSGKSSLMFCGFVPALHGGFMTETGPNWSVVISRPGKSPIKNLATSVVELMVKNGKVKREETELFQSVISSILRSGTNGLVEVAKYIQTENKENIFFLIDQFEEIFRLKETQNSGYNEVGNEAQHYVKLILTAIRQTNVPIYVALTMRSDFIGECSKYPGLTPEINKSNYLVPQMDREQKRAAIEGPVAVAGGKISDRLVKKLLNDVGNNQDQLPILQHALMRTWDYWLSNHEGGEPMDLRHYHAVGNITQALSLHANELYDELTTRGKEIAEVIFKSITEKNQDNRGLRRPCRLGLIAQLAEASEDEVIKIIDHFRQPGRSFLMPAAHIPLGSDSMIELSHESLMRIWNRLAGWVEDEFESASMYKRLSEAAAMYQIGKTGLWRPPDLQLALNWQKKQRPTREWGQRYDEAFERAVVFLDTSRITYEAELKNQEMMQKRVLRRTRATAIILGIAFLVAILFFVFAYIQKLEADKDRIAAIESEREAEKQREDAMLQRKIAEESKLDAEKKAEEATAAKEATEDALKVAESQTRRAEAALLAAYLQEEKAKLAGQQEMLMKLEAENNAEIAEKNLRLAQKLYYLTKAQELASKAAVQDDDYQLAGLQAMQGYNFHTKYEGRKYDRYIYEGLYSAMAKLSGSSYNALKIVGAPRIHMRSLALSSDNNTFYVSGADGRIYKASRENLSMERTGFQTAYPSKVIAMSKDENYLVNGSDSTILHLYNLKNGSKPKIIKGFKGATNDIEFFPDNSGFVIASQDKTLRFYDLKKGELRTLLELPYEIKSISIRHDAKMLAAASWSGQILLINMQNNSIEELVSESNMRMLSVKFSSSGKYLAYGMEEGSRRGLVRLYEFGTKHTRQFTGHRAGVYDLEFSSDEKLLASAGSDKRLQLYVIDSLDDLPVVMENNNGFIWDIEFTKDSDYLIAACSESEIRVWPTDPALLAKEICPKLTRNMTEDEWLKYVGEDTDYENTCNLQSSN
jgi:WD40 repeat protein/energy-coupling factor transporter ATP-binding protein EcfA2